MQNQRELRRVWAFVLVLAVAAAGVGLYRMTHPPQVVISGGLAGVALLMAVRGDRLRGWAVPGLFALVMVLCAWAGLALNWRIGYPAAVSVLALVVAFLLAQTLFSPAETVPRWWLLAGMGAASVIVTVLRLLTLHATPPLHLVDEPWVLAWMVSYLRHGVPTDILNLRLSGEVLPFNEPLYQLGAWWLALFGQTVWAARAFYAVWLVPLAVFTGLAAWRFYGEHAGWFAGALAFLGSLPSAMIEIRNNSPAAALFAASLWLYAEAQQRGRLWLHFAAGLVMGLGINANLRMLVFSVMAAAGLYGYPYLVGLRSRRWWSGREVWLYAAGGLVGSLPILVPILLNFDLFILVSQTDTVITVQKYVLALATHTAFIAVHSPVEFALLVVAVLLAVREPARQIDRQLVVMLVVGHVLLAYAASASHFYMIRPLTPLYYLLIARLFVLAAETHIAPGRLQARRAAFAALVLALVTADAAYEPYLLAVGIGQPQQASTPAYTWLPENTEPGQRVLGPSTYYLWAPQTTYTTTSVWWLVREEWGHDIPEQDLWDMADADIIVYDPREPTVMNPASLFSSGYLEANGYEPLQTFPTPNGDIVFYGRP